MPDAPRGLVISFPRSGINWLRHCAESLSGMRTPGRPQLVEKGPLLFDRTHDVRKTGNRSDFAGVFDGAGKEVYQRVALLLRDPCECFTSHYLVRNGASFEDGLRKFSIFSNNIAVFDSLQAAEKRVFHFNEFVNQREGTCAFLRFFGLEKNLDAFDLEKLEQSSRAWYRRQHGLISESKRPQLQPKQHRAILQQLRRELGDALFQEYLGRYDNDEEGPPLAGRLSRWVQRRWGNAALEGVDNRSGN